ncbi:hypothetical protein WJX74_010965 [Apatococcus lobatus]|uniref:Inosine/uridine-preferring nucleoside hydrolase domain-containing protein n=2 Tax=Apatococcus TaxID=904362 RepID=A0AAW1SVI2_9CHLO
MPDIWLDCDPGHDDAAAIILAGYHPGSRLLGVSTVNGNASLHNATQNALRVLSAAGLDKDVKGVFPGASKPLVRQAAACIMIHGSSGLDGTDGQPLFPETDLPVCDQEPAICAMYQTIKSTYSSTGSRQKVQLVCTGPLTNAALLISVFPDVVEMVDIVLMGGSMAEGNTGPVAEFNIQVDPEAAQIVFSSAAHVTLVPLQVTHTAVATEAVLDRIKAGPPPAAAFLRIIVDMLTFFASTYRTAFGFPDPPVHDPCAVAYALRPELFQTKRMRVDVEMASPLSLGQTVCDVWGSTGRPPNVNIALSMDVEQFWTDMIAAFHLAGQRSPLKP